MFVHFRAASSIQPRIELAQLSCGFRRLSLCFLQWSAKATVLWLLFLKDGLALVQLAEVEWRRAISKLHNRSKYKIYINNVYVIWWLYVMYINVSCYWTSCHFASCMCCQFLLWVFRDCRSQEWRWLNMNKERVDVFLANTPIQNISRCSWFIISGETLAGSCGIPWRKRNTQSRVVPDAYACNQQCNAWVLSL